MVGVIKIKPASIDLLRYPRPQKVTAEEALPGNQLSRREIPPKGLISILPGPIISRAIFNDHKQVENTCHLRK